jgi:PRTRC genetic system protein C
MEIQVLKKVYKYDGVELPVPAHLENDPNALRAFHAALYPAVATADAVEVGVVGDAHVVEYRRTVGTKGRA